MPNIREYTAKNNTLRPSDLGYSAFETAGRRIGPLYNQAAQDQKEEGQLFEKTVRLFFKPPAQTKSGSGTSGGVSGSGGRGRGSRTPTDELSRGAPALGGITKTLATGSTNPDPNEQWRLRNGLDFAGQKWTEPQPTGSVNPDKFGNTDINTPGIALDPGDAADQGFVTEYNRSVGGDQNVPAGTPPAKPFPVPAGYIEFGPPVPTTWDTVAGWLSDLAAPAGGDAPAGPSASDYTAAMGSY